MPRHTVGKVEGRSRLDLRFPSSARCQVFPPAQANQHLTHGRHAAIRTPCRTSCGNFTTHRPDSHMGANVLLRGSDVSCWLLPLVTVGLTTLYLFFLFMLPHVRTETETPIFRGHWTLRSRLSPAPLNAGGRRTVWRAYRDPPHMGRTVKVVLDFQVEQAQVTLALARVTWIPCLSRLWGT